MTVNSAQSNLCKSMHADHLLLQSIIYIIAEIIKPESFQVLKSLDLDETFYKL